jgi:hypothetical protein
MDVHNEGMEKIILSTVSLERKGDVIKIRHASSGMVVTTTAKQLTAWAIAQLKKEFIRDPKKEL